ncbi:MAG TPA: NAD-dependent epimerase/dehydratase family protein [Pyrinomonadaceae bacterium]|jgi:UDP-glucose 4-epimerase
MKVLITGGAGFIGSHLADRLLERKDEVLVIDNYATARRDNLTPQDGLTVVEGTIADTDLVNRLFEEFKPEVVVHAAAAYRDPDDWAEDARTNVLGTANVMLAARRTPSLKRLIYFQTALGYGLKPIEQPITLKHPLKPEGSSYAISKTAGENYVELGGLDFLSFRLANAYGPRNLSGPLPTFYHRLTTGKPCFVMDTRRDFVFIDDLVAVVLKAIDGQGAPGYYHISSGSDFSIKELFDATVKALGIKLEQEVEVRPRNPDDTYTILLDPSKTNQTFDWQVTTPLEEGVRAAIDWYKEHGITQTYTHLKNVEAKDAKA